MSERLPLVSVIVPARNEARCIERCIRALACQDYPLDRIEVIVVDGRSDDGTARVARSALDDADFSHGEVVDNPARSTPSSLNIGLDHASGDVVCRVDARSFIPPPYVRRCVEILSGRQEVVVVGGAQLPVADPTDTAIARGIARALRNPWATGLARYRRRAKSGPSDTVYLGSFRASDVRSVGGWDARFETNQDFELNRRLAQRGIIWFEDGIPVEYAPRRTLTDLARQYRRFGRWKAAGWLEGSVPMSARQVGLLLAPALFAVAVVRAGRRRPRSTAVGVAAALALVDSRASSARMDERFVAMTAIPVIVGTWWLGIGEQLVRHLLGQRMLAR